MSILKRKQVDAVFGAYLRATNFTASGLDDTVTAAITSVLGVAGRNGASVPLAVSTSEDTPGVLTVGLNRVEIYDAATDLKIADTTGNEVYGRITQAGGIYTLAYYTLINGVETAYNGFVAKVIDFEFIYRYAFSDIPAEAFVGILSRNINEDPTGSGAKTFTELRSPTAANTVPNLTNTPNQNYNILAIINGQTISTQDSPTPFSVSASKVVAWNASSAGYSLATTDNVVFRYTTLN